MIRVILLFSLMLGSILTIYQIQSSNAQIEQPLAVYSLSITSGNGTSTNHIVSDKLMISQIILNNLDTPQEVTTVFEISDSDNIVVFIAWQQNIISPLEQSNVSIAWQPKQSGNYSVRTFNLSDLTNLEILSDSTQSQFPVWYDQRIAEGEKFTSAGIFVKRISDVELRDQNVTMQGIPSSVLQEYVDLSVALPIADKRYDKAVECLQHWSGISLGVERGCSAYSYYQDITPESAISIVNDKYVPFSNIVPPSQFRGKIFGTSIEYDDSQKYYSIVIYLRQD